VRRSALDVRTVDDSQKNALTLSPVANALVIVESPSKARKIADYLGEGYTVESSIGHIRDLPRRAAEVPKAYKGEKWANIGIDVDNGFKPLYVVSSDKTAHVKKLKALMKDADELYLATDKDREGEAIAWHLLEVLNPKEGIPVKRMVFTEITEKAIKEALDSPRELDRRLVDAQETRRMLDRLVGYEVSPVLWKKVAPRLSAGRVQSVATRIVVQRERERMAFVSASYWDLTADFSLQRNPAAGEPKTFSAKLIELDGKRIASGRDFGQDGKLKAKSDVTIVDEKTAVAYAADIDGKAGVVKSRESRPYTRRPAAPFITSTFQQEANRKLGLSSTMAMRAAQGLYEKGFITYMRTDSTTLSDTAVKAARDLIKSTYGEKFLPDDVRVYSGKSKNAQEAHEAIRPAGDTFTPIEDVAKETVKSEAQVYELIYKRTMACQMTDATGETVTVRVGATGSTGQEGVFTASGTVIEHQGFRQVYIEEKAADNTDAEELALPNVAEGNTLDAANISTEGHDTSPPARYTEASLVKKLEELEVGRPSTYASIMETIQNRGYVWKKGSAMVPTFTAFSVINLMENHFPDLVDYEFTAQMEEDLNAIADGSAEAEPLLTKFYFGEPDAPGLKDKVSNRLGEIDARGVNSIPIGMDKDGQTVVARVGKFGPYVERSTGRIDEEGSPLYDRASIPDDISPDELTVAKAIEFIEAPGDDRTLGEDPETGLPVYVKNGRFGPYVQLGDMDEDDKDFKPQRSSLFKTMEPTTVTFEQALQLLSLPRTVGNHPDDGEPIVVQNGKFGPYLTWHSKELQEASKKADSRTLESEELLLTITVDECVALLKEPKRRRGQAAPKGPLKVLGEDPFSGDIMEVKDGRFGPYVTAGGVNASLRKGDTVEEITPERAGELLELRRIKMAEQGKTVKKKPAAKKKAAAKKKPAAKKKAVAKPAAKEAAAARKD